MRDKKIQLEIYSQDFDDGEDVVGNGMNGKIFANDFKTGQTIQEFKSIDKVLTCFKPEQIVELLMNFKDAAGT